MGNNREFKSQFYHLAYKLTKSDKYAQKILKYLLPLRDEQKVSTFLNTLKNKQIKDPQLLYHAASTMHRMGKKEDAISILRNHDVGRYYAEDIMDLDFSPRLSLFLLSERLKIYNDYHDNKKDEASHYYTYLIDTYIKKTIGDLQLLSLNDYHDPIVEANNHKYQILSAKLKQLHAEGKTFAIVGNGPSLKNRGLGELINSHDYIIRVNYYNLKGYEQDVGAKINLWATAASPAYQGLQKDTEPEDIICILGRGKSARKKNELQTTINRAAAGLELDANDFMMMDHITQMSTELYSLYRTPCTGFRAIIWITQILDIKASIFGFDFFQTTNTHYYDKEVKTHQKHGDEGKWYSNHDFKWENCLCNILDYQERLKRY